MGIVVVPINDSSAAKATDISADVNSTPIDLAISAVGVDPLLKADPCVCSMTCFVGLSTWEVDDRGGNEDQTYRPRVAQLSCDPSPTRSHVQ